MFAEEKFRNLIVFRPDFNDNTLRVFGCYILCLSDIARRICKVTVDLAMLQKINGSARQMFLLLLMY